jgi:hypothetical protein
VTDLADRYAPSRRGRLAVLVGAVVVVVSFLAWLAWSTWVYSTPDVSSELVGFRVTGEHEAVARVDVQLKDGAPPATCTLRATSVDHSVVGERSFMVPGPDATGSGTVSIAVRTERQATSVELVGCTTPDQSRPR